MPILNRLLASIIAVVLAAGVTATFIVEDNSGTDDSVASDDTPSTVDTVPEGSDDGTPADSSTTSTTGGSTSTAPTNADSTTTTTATTTTQATTTTTARPRPGTTPTAPGTYTYDLSGTVDGQNVNGTSTLTVTEPDGQGRQTQTEEGENGKTTTVYRFTGEGMFIEFITMDAQGQSFKLEATAPFLVIPANAQTGTITTGQLRGSGITADVTFTLLEQGTDTSRAQVDTELSGSAFGCKIDGDMTSTIVARSLDNLPIDNKSQSDINIKDCLFAGSSKSDTHAVLRR